jgi:hypothetical protein
MPRTENEETLTVDPLLAGDRPSLLVMGMVVARAMKKFGQACIVTDVLGRIVVMPKEAVTLLAKPLLKDEDLDTFDEDEAIALMVQEGREEKDILMYLSKRAGRGEP